jgi:DNA-directed RNA polymerase specialized sigma54-like protein
MLVQAVQMLNASWSELYELIEEMASKNPAVQWKRPERAPEVDVEVRLDGDAGDAGDAINISLAPIGELRVAPGGNDAAHRDAGWFVRCVEKRDETLLRVVEELASRQGPFLRGERDTPEQVSAHAVADVLAFHESTVRRAVANKVLRCRAGDLPLQRLLG